MDGGKFDSFARALANWSTRRRFLSSVIGSGAGAIAINPHVAAAQAGPTPTPTPCGTGAIAETSLQFLDEVDLWDLCASGEIDLTSQSISISTEEADPETDGIYVKPQFCGFYKQILKLIGEGTTAENWSEEQLNLFIDHWLLTVSAVSVGVADAFFGQQPRTGPGTPFPDASGGITSQASACTARCVSDALICIARYNQDKCGMYTECIIPFVECYIGITGENDPLKGCLKDLDDFCRTPVPPEAICCFGHCCGGGCKP